MGTGNGEPGTGNREPGTDPDARGPAGERPDGPGSGPWWVLGVGGGGLFPRTGQGWLEPALTEETLDKCTSLGVFKDRLDGDWSNLV